MKLRKKLCVLMLAALLLQLFAGCRTADDPVESSAVPEQSSKPTHSEKVKEPEIPGQSEEPEETPEPDLWDPNHTLDFTFTPARGLELPVSGATGYASVKLPLWEELPEENEGKLVTIYNPPEPEEDEGGEEEGEEETPEPGGEPSAEPGGPAPEPTPEPAAEPAAESAPEPTAEPAPEATAEPTPEPTPEPSPEVDTTPDWLVTGTANFPAFLADGSGDDTQADEPEPDPADEPSGEPESVDEPPAEPAEDPTDEPEDGEEPEEYDPMEGALLVLEPGTAFTILSESGDWWQVQTRRETGWVEHRYCLINLPDVVPSIVYNATNAYSSAFVSSGRSIPNVTGKQLYHGKEYNARLGYKEFMMPVLYTMAKDVCQAQQNALAEGNTIVLYEGFRPYETQMVVVRNLTALSRTDSEVKAGITTQPWNISWFIATGVANHQLGYAMDVSLAKVAQAHVGNLYGYNVVQVDEYEEYTMPTAIHELSMAAATFTQPVGQHSDTAWRYATLSPTMAANKPALALQRYCTEAKLTPLSSEWWHFNDLQAYGELGSYAGKGDYVITECLSAAPQ